MSAKISQPTQVILAAYAQKSKDAVILASAGLQLAIFSARAFNRSGGTVDVGIVRKFASVGFSIFTFDATTYTSASLAAATTFFPTSVTGRGFVFQSKKKSGLIGLNVSQAGATGVYVYEYWNGTAWSTLTTIEVPDFTSTGIKALCFIPPYDWAVGGGGALDSSKYSVRVTDSTAPATAVKVDSAWGGQLLEFYSSLANNTSVQIEFDSERPLILDASEGIMPYFGGVANAANGMNVAYSTL